MSRLRLSITALLCLPLAAPVQADQSFNLQTSQIQALGLVIVPAASANGNRSGGLPARVLVPNEQMRVISAPVSGMIELLAVAPGDTVKRGQVLARLASPQALELQREVLQSTSQSHLLLQNLKRDEQLFAEGLIAESRLQATRAASAQAEAQASERRQGLTLAGAAPGKLGGPLVLLAPIDGVVLEQGVQLGQRVDSAALIYRIAKLSPLWLEIQAPVELASSLRLGMPIPLVGSTVSGKLIAIGRAVESTSQTVLLRAEVHQGAEGLRPGQLLEVELSAADAGLRLPASAVVHHQDKALVFIQSSSNSNSNSNSKEIRLTPRVIRILAQGGDTVSVEGVKADERIVVRGASSLKAMLTGVGRE